jgi:hypothetical protein
MTTARRQRCVHCHSPYVFRPSFYGGEGVNYPYNHHEYCSDCFKVVKKALSAISAKYEKRFVPSENYTKEQILNHQESRLSDGVPIRRIMPTLFDITGKTRHEIVCEVMPDGDWYKVEWWSHEPEKTTVTKETWCSL